MGELNGDIAKDTDSLGPGFQIGHSFFTPSPDNGPFDEAWYRRVVINEILPLLEDYWFEDQDQTEKWRQRLLESSADG